MKGDQIVEYTDLCKVIRKRIREEKRKFNMKKIREAITLCKSLKHAKQNDGGRSWMTAIIDEGGNLFTDRKEIVDRCMRFYKEFYSKCVPVEKDNFRSDISDVENILKDEVAKAFKEMKNKKALGKDGLLTEMLKEGGAIICDWITKLFNNCLNTRKIPKAWCNACIILLFKKGDKKEIKNYRPFSLLSHLYKLFTRIIKNRLTKELDLNQLIEQAGFRSSFSTTDYIHTIQQLIGKSNEYQKPLILTFIDFEKAFDSVEHQSVINALRRQGVEEPYVELIKHIYDNATSVIMTDKTSESFKIERGVRQGDPISPKLFSAVLEDIFRRLNWEDRGVKINGKRLNHLRFADDIVTISETAEETKIMLTELNTESKKDGMKMHMGKTKVMFKKFAKEKDIIIENQSIEKVEEYVYVGTLTEMSKKLDIELSRRITAGWKAFWKYKDVLKSELSICMKRKIFNQCILSVLTYGCETWTSTKKINQRLAATQRAMEKSMLGITRRDRKSNKWIREQTKVMDVVEKIRTLKWRRAGHIARMQDNRWTNVITS